MRTRTRRILTITIILACLIIAAGLAYSAFISKSTAAHSALFGVMLIIAALFLALEHANARDIRRAEREAQEHEKQFRIVAGQSSRSVLRYDIAKKIAFHVEGENESADTLSTEHFISSGKIAPESREDALNFERRVQNGESPIKTDILTIGKNGEKRWFRMESSTVFDKKGRPETAIISYFDCTRLLECEKEYEKWEQELEQTPNARFALYEWNLTTGVLLNTRGGLADDFKLDSITAFGERVGEYAKNVLLSDRESFIETLRRERLIAAFHNGEYGDALDYREITPEGGTRWLNVSVRLTQFSENSDIKLCLAFTDVDEKKRAELAAAARAQLDSMTGAFNRDTITERVNAALCGEPSRAGALLMLDIDGFRQINDMLGHDAGDSVLADIIRRVRMILRADDDIGRVGGDEFVILLPDMPYDAAIAKRAEQICAALNRQVFGILELSVSIGIAVCPRDGKSFAELYTRADAALFDVKKHGGNNFAFYRGGMTAQSGKEPEGKKAAPQKRSCEVIVVADSAGVRGELLDFIDEEYAAVAATGRAGFIECLEHTDAVNTAVIVDADGDFGKNVLDGARSGDGGVCYIAVTGDARRERFEELISKGAVSVLPKPITRELVLLQLRAVFGNYEIQQSKLQKTFYKLQSADDLRYREVLNATGTMVYVYDAATRTYQEDLLSERFKEESGFSESELFSSGEFKALLEECKNMPESSAHAGSVLKLKTRGGELRAFKIQVVSLEALNAHLKLLVTVNDVDSQTRANEELKNRAERDPLTGLYNRETFFIKCRELLDSRAAGYYVMSSFDIDSFKVINDQYGTDKGDEVLIKLAKLFDEGFGAQRGVCCRVSADNFAVLYPRDFLDGNEIDIMHGVSKAIGPSLQQISYSIGRYVVDDPSLPVSTMYDRANIARVAVKGRFDTHIMMYDESMRTELLERQEIVDNSVAALNSGEFEVWYQPQYNHTTGALIGSEALVRWRTKKRGLMPPNKFIPVFESNGFVYEMDKYVWERVCEFLRREQFSGRELLPVAVNVSRCDVCRSDFYAVVTGLVEKYGIPRDMLRLEITESALANATEQIISVVERLREYGMVIEIDDFGSGYSSLNTLKDVPADIIKLDMRFIEGGKNSARGGNILESVVRMAKWLNTSVIAEGVETKEQADFLSSIGCPYIQGFYYGRPMPAGEYERLMASSEKQPRLKAMEMIDTLDNNAFWNPASQETLIFNSYIGGAFIAEYRGGELELLRVNEKCANALAPGLTADGALKLSLFDRMDDENRTAFKDCIEKAVASRDEERCTACLKSAAEGEAPVYAEFGVRMLARVEERCLLYFSVDDVTARVDAERTIAENARQLRALNEQTSEMLNNIPCGTGVYEILPTGLKPVYLNDMFAQYLGRTRGDAYGEDATADVHPDDRAELIAAIKTGLEENAQKSCDIRIMHASGKYIPFEVTGKAVRREGRPPLLYVTYFPLTDERWKAQRMLPLMLKATLRTAEDMIFFKDTGLVYVYASRSFARMAGFEKESDVMGKTDFDLFSAALAEKYRADDTRVLQGGEALTGMTESLPDKDGARRTSLTSKFALRDDKGDIIGLYGVCRDIESAKPVEKNN